MVEQRAYPPFHIAAAPETLEAFGAGITSFAPVFDGYKPADAAPHARLVWIKNGEGFIWAIGVTQRDLEYRFEVFSLRVETGAAFEARLENPRSVHLPADAPDKLRAAAAVPRAGPVPQEEFRALPFKVCRTEVLRRAEFIVSNVDAGPTLGEKPTNIQSAAARECAGRS